MMDKNQFSNHNFLHRAEQEESLEISSTGYGYESVIEEKDEKKRKGAKKNNGPHREGH